MGTSPILLEDGRWAVWGSSSEAWSTTPCSREEIEKFLLLEGIEREMHSVRMSTRREAGEWRGPRRFHQPEGSPPEDDDLDDGEPLIPPEVSDALDVIYAWAKAQDDEVFEKYYADRPGHVDADAVVAQSPVSMPVPTKHAP